VFTEIVSHEITLVLNSSGIKLSSLDESVKKYACPEVKLMRVLKL
jgi:hypothetical protein